MKTKSFYLLLRDKEHLQDKFQFIYEKFLSIPLALVFVEDTRRNISFYRVDILIKETEKRRATKQLIRQIAHTLYFDKSLQFEDYLLLSDLIASLLIIL